MAKASKENKELKPFEFEDITESLTDRQMLFCQYYVGECKFNGSQSALRAGYSENCSKETASYLLTNPNIKNYIDTLKKDLGLRIGVTAEMIANEYKKIGFFDVKNVLTVDGGVKDIHELDNEQTAVIKEIELFEISDKESGEKIGTNKKIKFHDKLRGLENLSKMIGVDGVTKIAPTDPEGKALKREYTIKIGED